MMKLTIVAAAGALALFAVAASQPATAGSYDHMTPMPKASAPHAYTPAPKSKDAPKDYAHMTPMPSGSVTQAQRAQQAQHK